MYLRTVDQAQTSCLIKLCDAFQNNDIKGRYFYRVVSLYEMSMCLANIDTKQWTLPTT